MMARTRLLFLWLGGSALLMSPSLGVAQSLADRVEAVRDGKVRMSFAARPDVCGSGRGGFSFAGSELMVGRNGREDWEWECEHGPIRVVLELRGGAILAIDTYVAGHWRSAGSGTVDLGTVSAPQAARYLLSLARGLKGASGRDAIVPACWPTV